ncbi:hypothetical protein FOZ62_005975, partial [Perkinsus olseni]
QDRIKWLEEGQRKSLELRAIDRGPTPCARCLRCRCRVQGAALEDEVRKQEAASDGSESRKRSPEIRDLEGRNRQQGRSFLYKFSRSSAGSYGGVDKQALSTAIVEANETLGKTLTYFSIFCDQNDIYFVLKYETPTRWKQLADTLRNKYGISTSVSCAVPKPGYRTCMYPVLFSYCLDLDPNPYLSPNHPHPSSLLGDGEKQGSRSSRTPALDAGGLPALPPSRGAEEEGNVPEGDGAPTVKIPGEDNQSIIDESAGCVEGSPLDQVEQCLERGCICRRPGLWVERISSLVVRNLGKEGAKQVREDIRQNLEEGRSKETNVVIYGVASSGKTAILRPLTHILKCAKISDAEEISPEDLLDCECILWSHFSVEDLGDNFDMTKLPDLLDGRPVEMSCSSDRGNSVPTFDKLVPIFLTCDALPAPFEVEGRQALHERLQRCHYFPYKMEPEERKKPSISCNRCFAEWLFADTLA